MALTETGGRQTIGASGEYGALQFMPGTWACASRKVFGKVERQSNANEWYVSVLTVQSLLNKHPSYTAYEIGMIWNGSLCGSEQPIAKHGTNKKGVKYNTVEHAKKVLINYYQVMASE